MKGIWIVSLLSLVSAGAYGQQAQTYKHPAADPQHDLTAGEFFRDVGGAFKGLLSVNNILPAVGWGGAYGLATWPEQDLEAHFAPGGVWGNWSVPGRYIGNPALLGGTSVGLFALSRRSADRRFRSLSYSLLQGSIMSSAIVQSLKPAFSRLRPSAEDHLSFPSGHASDSFLYATIFAEHYGWKAAVPGYAFASYVATTRLADRKHHMTDVVAGAGIGFVIGHTVSRRMRRGPSSARVSWSVFPSGRGVGCSVRFELGEVVLPQL